jgi:hypothetical protein
MTTLSRTASDPKKPGRSSHRGAYAAAVHSMLRLQGKSAAATVAVCAVVGLAVAGCTTTTAGRNNGPSIAVLGKLTQSSYPVCAARGLHVAQYLLTGKAVSIDSAFGPIRASILKAPRASRNGLIRAQANQVIANCNAVVSGVPESPSSSPTASASASP